jgi:hypothetical protein
VLINWAACERAMRAVPYSRRHWVVKHTSGFCSVGKMMHRWKQWPSNECPRCGEPEDAAHVWRCSDPEAVQLWSRSVAKLRCWLVDQQTAPDLCHAICLSLLDWHAGVVGLPVTYSFLGVQATLDAQASIGWQPFLEGCLSPLWQSVQHSYYEWMGSRKSGRRWVSALIRKLWEVAWDQWEHRNGAVHRSLSGSISQQLQRDLRRQHHLGPMQLPRADQALFNIDLQDLLSSRHELQTAWLANVQAARTRATARDVMSFRGERALMRRWLAGGS